MTVPRQLSPARRLVAVMGDLQISGSAIDFPWWFLGVRRGGFGRYQRVVDGVCFCGLKRDVPVFSDRSYVPTASAFEVGPLLDLRRAAGISIMGAGWRVDLCLVMVGVCMKCKRRYWMLVVPELNAEDRIFRRYARENRNRRRRSQSL